MLKSHREYKMFMSWINLGVLAEHKIVIRSHKIDLIINFISRLYFVCLYIHMNTKINWFKTCINWQSKIIFCISMRSSSSKSA
jgi:hypothetical protein